MIDPFVLLAPVLLLAVVALLRFVGCATLLGVDDVAYAPAVTGKPTATPALNPPPGAYNTPQSVFLSDTTPGATIYFTTDGTNPTIPPGPNTRAYNNVPIQVSATTTIIAIAQAPGFDPSLFNGGPYTISVAPTPITFRQLAENLETVNNAQVTTAGFAAVPDAGNLMVVWVWYNSSTQSVSKVADNAVPPNSYQLAVGQAGVGALTGWRQEIWYARNITSGANFAVTAIFTGPFNAEKAISAHEYHGADQTSPEDHVAGVTGSSSNASLGPVPAVANELIFGAALFQGSGSAAPGFSPRSALQSNVTEDRVVTSAGPVPVTFVNTPQDWIAQMVTFK